jgi:ABC-2 type transport system permease protein
MKNAGIVSTDNQTISTDKLQQKLSQTYNVRQVSLDQAIPADVQTILMNGAEDSLSLDKLYNLDQFLMRGGKLMLGQAHQVAHLQEGYASEIESNIFDFLEHYGLRIGKDLLIDRNCGQISIQQRRGIFSFTNAVSYPAFPLIHSFNKESMIVKNLEQVQLFFVNEITQCDTTANFVPLLNTSDKTGAITAGMVPHAGPYGNYQMVEGYNISPHLPQAQMNNPAMVSFPLKSKNVAAMVSGPYRSYFADNPKYNQKSDFLEATENAEILLVTDNEFFDDNRAAGIPENADFILNSIDYLAGDQELLVIRSRTVTARPLKDLSDASRHFWKWLNIILPALLVIIFGLVRWRHNVTKRKLLEGLYD